MNAPLKSMSASPSSPPAPGTPVLRLDPRAYDQALHCVHCGLCLPACPTYTETGHEADSPRGRIELMRGLADGTIALSGSVQRHLDLCLDCRGCETACPSGVVYHELIEDARLRMESRPAATSSRLLRWIFLNVLTHPLRLRLALLPPRILQKLGVYGLLRRWLAARLPPQFRKLEQMLPATGPLWPRNLPPRIAPAAPPSPSSPATGAAGAATMTVGFLTGCVGSVMYDQVNRQAADLLAACGAQVVAPREQVCCGAIHHHNSAHEGALERARRNIDTFLPAGGGGCDRIVTVVAGCGAMLREYDTLLRDDPAYAERAREFASRVRDVTEVLLELNLPARLRHRVDWTVTYHDACHLAHAQKVTDAPRALLAKVPGLRVVPLPESDICCGAAGTYNLTQPEMATRLAMRKLDNIAASGASVLVAGNVGCSMHIQSQAQAAGRDIRVVHPVEILHRSLTGQA